MTKAITTTLLLIISLSLFSDEKEPEEKTTAPLISDQPALKENIVKEETPLAISSSKDKINTIKSSAPYKDIYFHIIVDIEKQKLYLCNPSKVVKTYDISSSKYGIGETENSYKTPTGTHRVVKKIGADGPLNGIYKDRKFTGTIAQIQTEKIDTEKDYITSRILWLDGLEDKNKNSKQRYIYIHGTYEEGLIGTKASHGCIRMNNKDVVELFDFIPENTLVEIVVSKADSTNNKEPQKTGVQVFSPKETESEDTNKK